MNIHKIQWQQTLAIRHKVLWPDKSEAFCKVSGDETATHFGVYLENNLVCVASIYLDGTTARLRKFATLESFQNQGIGKHVISHIISTLKKSNCKYFWCDARVSAIGFYSKFNMSPEGDEFNKSGVQYIKMKVNF